jgi:hypothetical protein
MFFLHKYLFILLAFIIVLFSWKEHFVYQKKFYTLQLQKKKDNTPDKKKIYNEIRRV